MKKLLLIPTTIFPYTVCLCIGYGYNFGWSDTPIAILGILSLVTLVLSFVCNLIYIFTTLKEPADKILNTAFIIKAIHIPSYILIFILGFILSLMFFMTLPFILFLILVDLITLWLSGMISIYSIAQSLKKDGLCAKPLLIIAMICQFFFCADIISLFVVKLVMKKRLKKACV